MTNSIKKVKNYNALSSNSIPAEWLKHTGEALYRSTHKIIQDIWQEEKMSHEWKEGVYHTNTQKRNKAM